MAKAGSPADPLNPTLEQAAATVGGLVQTFAAGEDHYFSSAYSEAQARKDFIDKFLIALAASAIPRVSIGQSHTIERVL